MFLILGCVVFVVVFLCGFVVVNNKKQLYVLANGLLMASGCRQPGGPRGRSPSPCPRS
jgi:hypothetical protein